MMNLGFFQDQKEDKGVDEKPMLRARTRKLFELLVDSGHQVLAVVTHKGYLRELEQGPLGQETATEFSNCEVRVYQMTFTAKVTYWKPLNEWHSVDALALACPQKSAPHVGPGPFGFHSSHSSCRALVSIIHILAAEHRCLLRRVGLSQYLVPADGTDMLTFNVSSSYCSSIVR
jgi:hypothetical protein